MNEMPKGSTAAINLHSGSQVLVLKAADISNKENETVALNKLHEMTALMSKLVDVVAKSGGGEYKVRYGWGADIK